MTFAQMSEISVSKKTTHQLREDSISQSKRTIRQYSFVELLNMKKSLSLIQFACLRTSFQSPNVADINTGNENQWSNQLPLRNSNGSFDFVLEKMIWVSRVSNLESTHLKFGWVGVQTASFTCSHVAKLQVGMQTLLIQEDSPAPKVELCFYFDATSSENA